MNTKLSIKTLLILLLANFVLMACKKEPAPDPVVPNKEPVCTIVSPANNTTFSSSDTIIVKVDATDADGSITKVEIFVDDIANGSPKTTAPYEFKLSPLTPGNHTIKATATDNKGSAKDATISVVVNYVPTVYIAGYENNSHASVAKYWKNGTAVVLADGTYPSAANGIFISGNDVYTAGYEFNGNTQLAKYWKNTTGTTLGTGASSANAIAVNNTDVFAGGWEIVNGFDIPRYWSNGTAKSVDVNDFVLPQVTLGNGQCSGMYLKDNNVYSVGFYRNSQGRFSPWETTNGFTPANSVPNNDKHCFANAVFVNGTDKYIVGNQNNPTTGLAMATIWKNGVATNLTDGAASVGAATAVFISGNDVYVAGWEQENYYGGGPQYAKYWKNGVVVKLATVSSVATGIAVFGNDVYVSGWESNGTNNIAKYWKNGSSVNLTNGTYTASANSIIVK